AVAIACSREPPTLLRRPFGLVCCLDYTIRRGWASRYAGCDTDAACIAHQVLALLHLDLGRTTNADDGGATGQLHDVRQIPLRRPETNEASDGDHDCPIPSCRRRPASTTCLRGASKVVDAGLRRHDGVSIDRAPLDVFISRRRLSPPTR